MLSSQYNFEIKTIIDKIIPKAINPFSALNNLGNIKDYFAQAKLAAFVLGGILIAILIALIILILKKLRKSNL